MLIFLNNFPQRCESFRRNFFAFFSVLVKLKICFTRTTPEDWRYLRNVKHCLGNFLISAIIRLLYNLYLFRIFDSIVDLRPEMFFGDYDLVYPDVFSNVLTMTSPQTIAPLSHFFSKHLIRRNLSVLDLQRNA